MNLMLAICGVRCKCYFCMHCEHVQFAYLSACIFRYTLNVWPGRKWCSQSRITLFLCVCSLSLLNQKFLMLFLLFMLPNCWQLTVSTGLWSALSKIMLRSIFGENI